MNSPAGQPIKVLLIEDSPGDVRLIQEVLAEASNSPFVLETADRLAAGLERLAEGGYGAVLLDLDLPDAFGLETLLTAQNHAPDVPIVVLTGLNDESFGTEIMHQGAQDYLTKGDMTPEGLTRSLRYAIGRHRTLQHLRRMSTIDELTGLHNRRGFMTLAAQQIKIADRAGGAILLVFTDLDGLKRINDTWGHDDGDQALIEAAEIIAHTFRESDIVARLGGDEFVVLMVECPPTEADALIERLGENLVIRNAEKGRRFELSMSVGTALCDPAESCSVEDLLRRADAAMYDHKRSRRKARVTRA